MVRSTFSVVVLAFASGQESNETDCQCPWTSSNRRDCCSESEGHGGEGSGDFCGNWFQKTHCKGDTPVCCNSDISASCGPIGSSCAPGCILGYKGLGSECRVIPPPAPSPASQAFSVPRAKAIANLAAAAGCGPTDDFKTFTCKACRDVGFDLVPGTMRYVTHNDLGKKNATFAFIARLQSVANSDARDSEYGCAIGIRGSDNLANYIQDAEFWRKRPSSIDGCHGCKVHAGFYHAWMDLEEDAVTSLADIGCSPGGPNSKVLVTGHSLGAAASVMAMFRLKGMGFDVQQSVVFEPPRLGNKAFSEAFAARFEQEIPVFMHTHAMDPVVHLPPKGIPFIQYVHVNAPEVYYFPSFDIDDYIVCEGPDDPACSARYALTDTIASGDDHCKNFPLAPSVNPKDGLRDFCYHSTDFCSGGNSNVVV